ncbi:TPA: cysteine desulfurase NifS [Candidatus Poribacteria bacterium]|nr:cysteine desulfurase NifS [Candidatus Poribacteria bacterium]
MKRIYLDHNATTPVHPEVKAAMLPYYEDLFGNASSVHSYGREAREAIDVAREQVAELIGASSPTEIIFTSGGTESDNHAIKGTALSKADKKGNHIIISPIEHHAVENTCEYLEKRGFEVTHLQVDKYGIIDLQNLEDAIKDTTILISVMHANNEVGTIQPLAEVGKIAKERGILLHTDAVQSVGKIPLNVDELGVDLLSLSAHKIYGPKGIGALYIRKGTRIDSLLHGGHHERNRRAGTENVPGIVGLGKASEIAKKEMEANREHLWSLTEKLRAGIQEEIEFVRQNGHPEQRLPNTLNFSFEFVEGEALILSLDMQGICVSTGSACTSGSLEPSHVLAAIGLPPEIAHGSVRISLGRDNTEEEINYVLETLPSVVNRLRAMSPLYADRMKKRKEGKL